MMMVHVYLVFLCANTIAIIEPLHYYVDITDVKTDAQKGHKHSKHWSWNSLDPGFKSGHFDSEVTP